MNYNNLIWLFSGIAAMVILERIMFWTKWHNANKRRKKHDEDIKNMRMTYHMKEGGTR